MAPKRTTDIYYDNPVTVVRVGNVTVEVYRPILTEEERKRRENEVVQALAAFGRELYANQQERSVRNG